MKTYKNLDKRINIVMFNLIETVKENENYANRTKLWRYEHFLRRSLFKRIRRMEEK